MFRKILVGIDGSPGGSAALRRAILFARDYGAELHALAVEEHLPRFAATVGETEDAREEREAYFAKIVSDARRTAVAEGVAITCELMQGNPAKSIIERGRELQCDLIVIGHSSHAGGVWGNLLGSTADRVVDHAHSDVLVVR
jgi:nucleotide-binding universal stress UspA family protein